MNARARWLSAPRIERRDSGGGFVTAWLAGLTALGVLLIVFSPRHPSGKDSAVTEQSPAAAMVLPQIPAPPPKSEAPSPPLPSVWRVEALRVDPKYEILDQKFGTRSRALDLSKMGLSKGEVRRLLKAYENVRPQGHAPPTERMIVARERTSATVVAAELIVAPTEIYQATETHDHRLSVRQLDLPVDRKPFAIKLGVVTDLSNALVESGWGRSGKDAIDDAIEDALEGRTERASIQPGLRMRLVGAAESVEGSPDHTRIDAIEFVPRVGSAFRVYWYERDPARSGRRAPPSGYYDAKGQRPYRGMFRSPVPLARVTSRFNPKRMHPVLHVVMPHNGVDFGASSGTAVFASAAGSIASAGDSGPCGNMVQVSHPNGLTTAYCHLSRFAPGLHSGQHVEARQLLGYVGQTGRATGPHLHFAVKRGQVFVDPLALKMDGVTVLARQDREAFGKRVADLDRALDAMDLPPPPEVPASGNENGAEEQVMQEE